MAVLKEADAMWVELILNLAGASKPDTGYDANTLRRAHAAIFGRGMKHLSAAATARPAATAAMAAALSPLLKLANTHSLNRSSWARILDLPLLADRPDSPLPQSAILAMHEELLARAAHAQKAYDAAVDDLGGTDELNLWVEALRSPSPVHVAAKAACGAAQLPESRAAAVSLALARVLRVPIWKAISAAAPHAEAVGSASECELCKYVWATLYDLTVVSGDPAKAEKHKTDYYEKGLTAHPHYAFTPFGVCLSGADGPGAKETLNRWSANLVRQRKVAADLPGRPRDEVVGAFALSFATVAALQIAAYTSDVMAKRARSRLGFPNGHPAFAKKRNADWKEAVPGRGSLSPSTNHHLDRSCGGASAAATGDIDNAAASCTITQDKATTNSSDSFGKPSIT